MKTVNPTKKIDLFDAVLNYVKQGLSITDACYSAGCSRATLYRNLTETQKWELKSFKLIQVESRRQIIPAPLK